MQVQHSIEHGHPFLFAARVADMLHVQDALDRVQFRSRAVLPDQQVCRAAGIERVHGAGTPQPRVNDESKLQEMHRRQS
ncbi:MAG: hypothetical protein WDN49_04565 [Acetobacteraceae bacterium]